MSEAETDEWYRNYYAARRDAEFRNDILGNPEVLWQVVARDAAVYRAMQRFDVTTEATWLDVGCGGGRGLAMLLRLGFGVETIVGVDLLSERVDYGKSRIPGLDIRHGDATALDFPDGSFDVVYESTMFAQLTDNSTRERIAHEMARVARPGGLIMLVDWRLTRPSDKSERALRRSDVRRLFDRLATLEHVEPAALAPPLGRRLSARAPSLYFLVRRLLPFAASQVVYVLRKPGN